MLMVTVPYNLIIKYGITEWYTKRQAASMPTTTKNVLLVSHKNTLAVRPRSFIDWFPADGGVQKTTTRRLRIQQQQKKDLSYRGI